MSINEQEFDSDYDIIPAPPDLAGILSVSPATPLLRRQFTAEDRRSGILLSTSVSYIPVPLVEVNPAILDESNEPWPGGTLHALATVGIEIMKVVHEVSARMPSSADRGVPGARG